MKQRERRRKGGGEKCRKMKQKQYADIVHRGYTKTEILYMIRAKIEIKFIGNNNLLVSVTNCFFFSEDKHHQFK